MIEYKVEKFEKIKDEYDNVVKINLEVSAKDGDKEEKLPYKLEDDEVKEFSVRPEVVEEIVAQMCRHLKTKIEAIPTPAVEKSVLIEEATELEKSSLLPAEK